MRFVMQNGCEMLIELLFVGLLSPGICGFGKTVYIGGLFEKDSLVNKAFRSSIIALNDERHKIEDLPAQIIQPHFVETVRDDSYDVSRTVCNLANSGVAALFGPHHEVTSRLVQGMCDTMGIPHVMARWDSQLRGDGLINMFPHSDTLATVLYKDFAFLQFGVNYEWKTLTIIYQKTENLIRMNKLLKKWYPTVTVWQLTGGPNYRHILREVKSSGVLNIVIDCSIDILPEVLKQAHQVGIMTDKHSYIITSLDLQTIDLEPYQHGGTNFTGFRLIDPDDPLVRETFNREKYDWDLNDPLQLTVEAALVYDGVQLFGRALKELDNAIIADVETMLCDNRESWVHGKTLSDIMKKIKFQGLTGQIQFDPDGYRTNFKLGVITLEMDGVRTIGAWNSSSEIEPFSIVASEENKIQSKLRNETFIVLIALTQPYGMLKKNAENKTGNDRYEGYCIDIIQELSKRLGFKYTLKVSYDVYGTKDSITGEWNGLIREIMDGRADLAIADLTITSDRQEVVDFTMPFMNLGISILFTKPLPRVGLSSFSFLLPFSTDLWICLLGAYTFCALLTFVLGRFCPAEWNNPYPCIKEPEVLVNQFTDLTTVFYSNLGSIMQQGPQLWPIGLSTRMMACSWSFFCLIMTSTYTANLAACLLTESKNVLIKNVADLANNQHGIRYGAKRSGSTIDFFKASTKPVYERMYKYMQENSDEVLLPTNDAGVDKVLHGNYAFLMESSTISYQVERNCELDQVGTVLDSKSYGIAMKKHSVYRNALSTAVLELQDTGVLRDLRNRWWIHRWGGEKCSDKKSISEAKPLGTDNVFGICVVLIAGIALASVRAYWELIREVWCRSIRKHVSFKEEMMEELKFMVKFSAIRKPARRRRSI